MGFLEAFLAAGIAGFGGLLAAVAWMAWRKASDRKMAVLCLAFAAQAAGGAVLLVCELTGSSNPSVGPLGLALATLVGLVLLYAALFTKRD